MEFITDKGLVNIVNKTPHTIVITNGRKEKIINIPPDGNPIRIEEIINNESDRLQINGNVNIPVYEVENDINCDIPEQRNNTYYIVSRVVAESFPDRSDLLVPHDFIRDSEGVIIGCTSFKKII